MEVLVRLYKTFSVGWWESAQVIVREEVLDKDLLDILCEEFDSHGWSVPELEEDTAWVECEDTDTYGRLWVCPPHKVQYDMDVVNREVARGVVSCRFESVRLHRWLRAHGYLTSDGLSEGE
jgi:hypothetical protein